MRSMLATLVVFALSAAWVGEAGGVEIHKRFREERGGLWTVREAGETWTPSESAIIVCDMWDSHHCLNAVRRVNELAPRMNAVLGQARALGMLIIHAPSGCMAAYEDHPGRAVAKLAPTSSEPPADIDQWCRQIPSEERGVYPIDQTQGGEDDDPAEHAAWHARLSALGRDPKLPWKRQTPLLTIAAGDAISDSGVEIWNLLESRGVENVVLLGVHTNMCVLGRPFGLRQMARNGKNVVLMRDMTDTMYDPAAWPYVNHFAGTTLIVEHIEKFVCPTITSHDLVGGEPFRFARDRRRLTVIIGEDEYETARTLPAFVASDLEPLGFEVTVVEADAGDPNHFPRMAEAIEQADAVLISVRRRLPTNEALDALRRHVASGKPLIGVRTASHAWLLRDEAQNEAAIARHQGVWREFDADVLGGHYTNHHPAGPKTAIRLANSAADHPILRGVAIDALAGNGALYKVSPLGSRATPLLWGEIAGAPVEPIAWTNLAAPGSARVFYTSLGHPDDFESPAFRKLLVNGILWAIDQPYATVKDIDELLPSGG